MPIKHHALSYRKVGDHTYICAGDLPFPRGHEAITEAKKALKATKVHHLLVALDSHHRLFCLEADLPSIRSIALPFSG